MWSVLCYHKKQKPCEGYGMECLLCEQAMKCKAYLWHRYAIPRTPHYSLFHDGDDINPKGEGNHVA